MDSNLRILGGTTGFVSGLRVSDTVNKAMSAPSLLPTQGTGLPFAGSYVQVPAPPPRDAPV